MAETQAPQSTPNGDGTAAPEGEKPPEDQRIPYSRFEEVNARAKRAEKDLEEMRQRIVDFEERDKSEAERAQARAQRAEAQLSQLQGAVTAMQKGAWVRAAATELGFHDPEDAVAHLGDKLGGLEDERDAKRSVKTLAQAKKHLIRSTDPEPERPRIGRVFSAEERAQQGDRRPLNREQEVAVREAEFAQSLAGELAKFRSSWREMGGIT